MSAQATEFLLHDAAEILDEVKPVGDLACLGRAAAHTFGVWAMAVPTDHSDRWMCRQPGGHGIRRSYGQHINDPMVFQIHQDGPEVVLAFLPRPVIDAEYVHGVRDAAGTAAALHEAQQGVVAHGHTEPIEEAFTGPPAHGVAHQLEDVMESNRPPRVRPADVRQSLGKDHGRAPSIATAPATHMHAQRHRSALRGQVLLVSASTGCGGRPTGGRKLDTARTAGPRPRPPRHPAWCRRRAAVTQTIWGGGQPCAKIFASLETTHGPDGCTKE